MNIIGIIIAVILAAVAAGSSRKGAMLALLASVCWLTQGLQQDVAGFHFTAVRMMLLVCSLRILARREFELVEITPIDKTLVAYALCIATISVIRDGTSKTLVYQLGILYDTLLSYFVARSLLRSTEDLTGVLKALPYIMVPLVVSMGAEALTGRNWFAAFGGVSEGSWVRDGGIRSMGPFRNPITAGSFGATMAPLFFAMIFTRAAPKVGYIGVVLSTIIVILAHSSGPLMAYVAAVCGMLLYAQRLNMSLIRRGTSVSLIVLHLIMKAPVWFLIGRISDLVGGGGYHRAEIIDCFVKRFSSWWLVGLSDTSDWMPTQLSFGESDITNRFVADGLNGGLLGFILMITLMVCCFKAVGRAMREVRDEDQMMERYFWCIGVCLFTHVVNQIAVTYFDQMYVVWYMLIAFISSSTIIVESEGPERSRSGSPVASSVLPYSV